MMLHCKTIEKRHYDYKELTDGDDSHSEISNYSHPMEMIKLSLAC